MDEPHINQCAAQCKYQKAMNVAQNMFSFKLQVPKLPEMNRRSVLYNGLRTQDLDSECFF